MDCPAPRFTAIQPEVADWSEASRGPLCLVSSSLLRAGAQPATEDWSAALTAQATEWVGTTRSGLKLLVHRGKL